MNLQSLVVVLLRIVSLNFLLQVLYQIAPLLTKLFEYTQYSRNFNRLNLLPYVLLTLLMIVGLLIGAVLVWIFALPIARFVTRGLPLELSFGALSLRDCYSIVFVGLGLYYAATYFPSVLNRTYFLLRTAASDSGTSWQQGVKGYDVLQVFLPFIVGIILFVNGRKWAVALAHKQIASPDPATSVEKKEETNA